jgi:energy-converting hydrogenase B subunit D
VIPLQLAILLVVAAAGTGVVLSRDPLRQAVANGAYGLVLTLLFVVFQAPDVALSMVVVGSIAYPLILLVAIKKVRGREEEAG